MKYSIVVPVYKEKNNISALIKKISFFLNRNKKKFELLIVDDDSNDGSKAEFEKSKKKNTKFLIRKQKPNDLSQSVLYGIKYSKSKNIIVMDGDLQHSPQEIIKLINYFEKTGNDCVIASRKFNKIGDSLSTIRLFSSRLLIFIFNFLFNLKISDPMSGFFVIKKEIVNKNKKRLFKKGYKILADIITCDDKIKIGEIFINFKKRKRNKSKMGFKILFILIYFLILRFISNKFKNH